MGPLQQAWEKYLTARQALLDELRKDDEVLAAEVDAAGTLAALRRQSDLLVTGAARFRESVRKKLLGRGWTQEEVRHLFGEDQ